MSICTLIELPSNFKVIFLCGLLDGIGLVVLILITIAFCSYCYRCCCHRNPTESDPRPRRSRRQKNARRKRRRRQRSRTPNTNNEPRSPNPQPSSNAPLQCNVDIYTEERQPVVMYPQYPSQQPQGQPFPQVHPYQRYQSQPYPQHPFQAAINLPVDHALYGQLSPPPYESHQNPQGQFQNFGVPPQQDMNFFPQVPPPPYDTQLCPQPMQQNRHFEDADRKF